MVPLKERIAVETSVLVAALTKGHPHHVPAANFLNRTLGSAESQIVISAHCLAEVFSVLTRAPAPMYLSAVEAWQIIQASLLPYVEIESLSGEEYREILADCGQHGWSGGKVYDLVHLRSARKARCTGLYTFNLKHFKNLASDDWVEQIVSP